MTKRRRCAAEIVGIGRCDGTISHEGLHWVYDEQRRSVTEWRDDSVPPKRYVLTIVEEPND